jgi:tetratricopeptide (TPR) repeat protein
MLETVREYALARLEQSADAMGARARHLDFHVRFDETAELHLFGPHENAWFDRCDLERQNLLAAYGFGLRDHPAAQPALRLVYAIRRWIARGAFDVGQPVLGELLARPGAQAPDLYRCRGLVAAGFLSYYKGAYQDAIRYTSEALAIARELDRPALAADAMNVLGSGHLGQDDRNAARGNFADAVALARETGAQDSIIIEALTSMAELHAIEGDLEK